MPPTAKTISRLASRVLGDAKDIPRIVQEGRRAAYSGEGTGSMFLWPLMALLKKLKGKEVVDKVLYEKYLRPIKNADEKAGRFLAHHGPSKSWFQSKEVLPTKRKIKGLPANIEYDTHSVLAPVEKIMKVVTPIAAGAFLSSKLASQQQGVAMATEEAKTLMKQAADAIDKHRRRSEAVKLAFLMVEKGKCKPFETYEEFSQKVASLETKNLDAVKEALDMDSELSDFGKVAADEQAVTGAGKAEIAFFHRLSE